MSLTRGSRSTKGNTSGYPASRHPGKHNNSQDSSSGRSDSRDACSVKEKLPEDVMVILVKNHKMRDESQKQKKAEAHKLLKEKQAKAQEEIRRKRIFRVKGVPLPEEVSRAREHRRSTEQFLLEQKQKRIAKANRPTDGQQEVMNRMADLKNQNMSEDQLRGLKHTIDGFNEMLFKKVSPGLAESFENVFPQPKTKANKDHEKKTYGRKAIDVEQVVNDAEQDLETQDERLAKQLRIINNQRYIF